MSLRDVFIIREASVGNIQRLLGLPDTIAQQAVEMAGKKFAYPIAKVFVDDLKGPWRFWVSPDLLARARKGDQAAVQEVGQHFLMFMDAPGGMVDTKGDQLLKFLQLDPSVEKLFYSSSEGSEALFKLLSQRFQGREGKTIASYPDGWSWKELSPEECSQEGELMQHCGMARGSMVSLRDPRGSPHVTVELSHDRNELVQIRGKQNRVPDRRYWSRVFDLEKQIGGTPGKAEAYLERQAEVT